MTSTFAQRLQRVARDPRRFVHFGRERIAGVRRAVDVERREVALTFDDGPDATYTPALLDRLAELDVPATFFVVGNAAKAQLPLMRRLIEAGHAIGIHTSEHADLTNLSFRAVRDELRRSRNDLEPIAGRPVKLLRPPHGSVHAHVGAAARLEGLDVWLWSVDPEDWRPRVPVATIASRARVVAGDVVVLHDGINDPIDEAARDRSTTIDAIGPIVEAGRRAGLRFVTLPH
jgi:peptidoglycan/xylan/chitin deacetylase (PgdA/CDA1 family)